MCDIGIERVDLPDHLLNALLGAALCFAPFGTILVILDPGLDCGEIGTSDSRESFSNLRFSVPCNQQPEFEIEKCLVSVHRTTP